MVHTDLVTKVRQHAAPLAADLGLDIWGIEIAGGNRAEVRLFVENTAFPHSGLGVDIEQCAELSRRLGLALEVDEVFADAWVLEVSSPGFERPFFAAEQLPPYEGRDIEITLAAPLVDWPGRKKFRGSLRAVEGEQAVLFLDATQRRADEPELVTIPWSHVRKAHLVHVFVDPEKPGKSKKAKPQEEAASPKREKARAAAED